MSAKGRDSNGLWAAGLGLLGGIFLGWAFYRTRRTASLAPAPKVREFPSSARALVPRPEAPLAKSPSPLELEQLEPEPLRPSEPAASPREAPKPDDLTSIEGIGPKIATILQGAEITTFAKLAATEVSQLEQILKESGLRLADPGTWPEQAKLAAAGDWEGLESLQHKLKGGRRA